MAERRYGLCATPGFFLLLLLPLSFSVLDALLAAAATLNKTQVAILRDIEMLMNDGYASTRWNTADSNPCLWAGIKCSSSGSSVIGITLSNYGIPNSSIFSSLCRLDSLQHLDLSRNSLTELNTQFFSPSCSMKKGLRFLNLSSNQLSHPLSSFSGFPLLQVLDLSFNYFSSGDLRADLGSFPHLWSLNLTSNELNGDVPTSMFDNLAELVLSSNQLSGSIPPGLFQYGRLTLLDLSQNKLTGAVPDEFSLSQLESLLLSGNELTGEIPASLFNVKTLCFLSLASNELRGPVPASISSLEKLVVLNLSHNYLSGYIPSDLGLLSELEVLNLSHNKLSGEVPSSLARLQSLTKLLLSYNDLSGSVPTFIPTVEIDIDGNPNLVNGTWINKGQSANTVLDIIFAAAGALVGLCFLLVVAKISFPKKIYRAENETMPPDEEGVSEIVNCCLITMYCICIRTNATMFIKEKRDDWRITAFQTLNFEAADILQGLTWANLVGSGGSGNVYRVTYTNRYNSTTGVVAVKHIQSVGALDEMLEHEFESEASILCNIRHNNIVKLLCCLSSAESKLLVYDYMDNGSLDRWLHGDYILRAEHAMARARPVPRVPLDWPTRLIAAVGAAQGLCYMHHNCSPPIIHRDVKTSNILLDSEFRAKVADFGLAKMLVQTGEPNTMTWVVGSFGYMAPEYAYTRKVTEKVDVFGFGVVLLELTTGKKATDGGDHGSLAEWAAHHYQSGASIPDATDICIRYAGYTDEIDTVFRLGVRCTGNSPSSRPSMEDVLQILLKCSEQTLRKSRLECSVE